MAVTQARRWLRLTLHVGHLVTNTSQCHAVDAMGPGLTSCSSGPYLPLPGEGALERCDFLRVSVVLRLHTHMHVYIHHDRARVPRTVARSCGRQAIQCSLWCFYDCVVLNCSQSITNIDKVEGIDYTSVSAQNNASEAHIGDRPLPGKSRSWLDN